MINKPDYPPESTDEDKTKIDIDFANDVADSIKNKDRKPPISNVNA